MELGLAVRQRLCPEVPTLVHDDASPVGAQLQELCGRYQAEFETNSSRLGHQMGDLSSLVGGLRWAQERGIDLLVKMSRRFIPLTNWVPDLTKLAGESQWPTYSSICRQFHLPIRSECMAMAVGEWLSADVEGEIRPFMLRHSGWFMAELYLIEFARKLEARKCDAARAWAARTAEEWHHHGFVAWNFISPSRTTSLREHLWHTANGPDAYAGVAHNLGLEHLGIDDFGPNPDA